MGGEGEDGFSAEYALAHLTLIGCSVSELIYIAARAGYDAVSPRLVRMGVEGECPYAPLESEAVRAAKQALRETAIRVRSVELFRITDDCDVSAYKAAMEAGCDWGAKEILVSVWTEERGFSYIADTFAAICDLAREYGLFVVLEFPTFSSVHRLDRTVEILRAADRPNAGLLIDTLYAHMSRLDVGELEKLPDSWFRFVHIADVREPVPVSVADKRRIAREERLYPGEGNVDFVGLLELLPPVDYAIELPNNSRVASLGAEEHARRCLRAAKDVLGNILSKRQLQRS